MSETSIRPVLHSHSRIGIVNRAEPAVRFIRAVREYNEGHGTSLSTIVFYLDEEADAVFVREADEALPFRSVPGATQAGSVYLERDALLTGLQLARCDAVWPGWGFVSEDAEFAGMVADKGIVFLGPDHSAMELLGDKIAAKDLAERSGVPILPWSKREIADIDDASEWAEQIGYPVIVKAAHAGGGRGIRFVMSPDELKRQFDSARDETRRVTGDDVVFIERLVQRGRHLEVQCLADRHGTVHTFGVRDCSIQRRNQKIIEETPPPGMAQAQIEAIEASAARLIKAARYESAGTVEFLYDLEREEYYFMEVNTRLQVEHPITEVRHGVDLVKGQIAVAFGKKLESERPPATGVVMEARLNAEDPDRDFTPSPGYVRRFRPPSGPGVRVDSGIDEGSTIPAIFDSMVAKIIVAGATRQETIARLRRALRETRVAIEGGTTNKAFLLDLLAQSPIRDGAVHTKYVEQLLAAQTVKPRPDGWIALVAAAIASYGRAEATDLENFRRQIATLGYPRNLEETGRHEVSFAYQGNSYTFSVRRVAPEVYHLEIDGTVISAGFVETSGESRLTVDGRRCSIQTILRGDSLQVEIDGIPYVVDMESGGAVKAPSPAVVLSVGVSPGDRVEKGTRLVSLEAMKMEMIIEAPSAGVVREIVVAPGQQVGAGEALVLLDTIDQADGADLPAAVKVSFPEPDVTVEREWTRTSQSIGATFLGYDRGENPTAELQRLVRIGLDNPDYRERLFDLIFRLLRVYVTVHALFSSERLPADHFARTVSWQEMLFIFFRYAMHGSDTLPQVFYTALDRALALYPQGREYEGSWGAFLHMERSRRQKETRDDLLRAAVLTLENLPVPAVRSEGVLRTLDGIVNLNLLENPSLADAALHTRYHLYDHVAIRTIRRRRAERIRSQLTSLVAMAPDAPERRALESLIIDSSPYVVGELLSAVAAQEPEVRLKVVELLARYMARDRLSPSAWTLDVPGVPVGVAQAEGLTTAVVVDLGEAVGPAGLAEIVGRVGVPNLELIVLCSCSAAGDLDAAFARYAGTAVDVAWLSVGIYREHTPAEYRTYHSDDGEWREDPRRRSFSPILYRELRVDRFSRFDTKLVYHSDAVYLLAASAKENPKDERFFALGAASESEPQLDAAGFIERVSEFDEVFMEAVFKMRSEQARRKRRLFWNRIIIHIRALIPASAAQIKEYGNRIIPRAHELGLEKAVIYTRRKRWSEDVVRELELLFLNISGDQFTLRSRKPSTEPLKTMDRYVSSVVRSRQRRNVYPYELVKMITFTGYPVSLNVPRGEFEEFDLAERQGECELQSVKGRPYGQNDSNVVFGLVRNQDSRTEMSYRRVLILSDSTRDMGSLAEPECRRIIAALDMAKEHGIPVEWVPVSSGARIDMESGTENLDWTAAVLKRIVEFTQSGGEINVIVAGINVGAQSYWNAEATMLMHTSGLLIMTDAASMLLTGKKALDFSGSVSGDTNLDIGGVEKIMGPNGQAQIWVPTLSDAYGVLFDHYRYTYRDSTSEGPPESSSDDPPDRDAGAALYVDRLAQGFRTVGDIFSREHNPERKKPFDMRQVMAAVIDRDAGHLERWQTMNDAETAITWETRLGGGGIGLIGIESRPLARLGDIPHDGPESWSGGTLFPQSSKKVARAINAWSDRVPVVVLANLSGFDGSPESLRRLQLEYGAEIGRAVVNFKGPLVFVVVARYHGGAYVVFSKSLNPSLKAFAIEGSYASVLGGAPAAAVVFPRQVEALTRDDERYKDALERLRDDPSFTQRDYDEVYRTVYAEKQAELGRHFDSVHDIARAKRVGSIDEIISIGELRPALIRAIRRG